MKQILTALLTAALLLTGCAGRPSGSETGSYSAGTAEQTVPAGAVCAYDTAWEPAAPSAGMPAAVSGLVTDDMRRRAVISQGYCARLAAVMRRAQAGEAVTAACIGGSITQGTGASSPAENYAALFTAWWAEAFPEAAPKLKSVNAGIGATGSYIGVHRLSRDLLCEKPDVVVVEFSVNDTNPVRDLESYDSLVRRILEQDNHPAVILLFMTQENGTSLFETHRKIGDRCDLPMISYQNAVLPEIEAGRLAWRDISPDNIHPNSAGHAIAAELLRSFCSSVLAQADGIPADDLSFSAEPVGHDRYQSPEILDAAALTPDAAEGFAPAELNPQFPHNWETQTAGSIRFTVTARNIGVLYGRTTDGRSGQYDVLIDGKFAGTLNGNFPNGWGNYAEAAEVFTADAPAVHTVEIRMSEASAAEGFRLLGLLTS